MTLSDGKGASLSATARWIEILEIREAGPGGGDLMGYYARGHYDHHSFAEAANHYSGADPVFDVRHVRPETVRQGWWRTVPDSSDPGSYVFHPAEPGSRGAFKVTFAQPVTDHEHRQFRRLAKARLEGQRSGHCDGVSWALRTVEAISAEVGKQFYEAWKMADKAGEFSE